MDKKVINNIKTLGIDMISHAKSGHPGIVLGAASIIYTLYANHIVVNPENPNWINRDRFIMSAGHGSALLYSTLFMSGFDISLEDLKKFRRLGSKTPGHPEVGVTPGVDMSTGPLGQGMASAVGMAIGEKILESKFLFPAKNKLDDEKPLFGYKIYALVGDGDLMEGISYEAASLAGSLKLNNLIVLYDSNNVSLDGKTDNVFEENVIERFEALGWNTHLVKDGNNINEIDKAISRAKGSSKPTIIQIKTTIGEGSLLEGTNEVHGKILSKDDIKQLKEKLEIDDKSFYVDKECYKYLTTKVYERGVTKEKEWNEKYNKFITEKLENDDSSIQFLFTDKINFNINSLDFNFKEDVRLATRVVNGNVLEKIADEIPHLIGGSADLASSTKTNLNKYSTITSENYNGRNIAFGVREHAMGAILNGLALTGFRPFGSTFLSFSDYLKPAMRMSSLMNLPVTYIFTHDSINVGSDGPTHEPIEQLAMLRSQPNLNVYRPADGHEIVGCWNEILNNNSPNALVLSRQETALIGSTSSDGVKYGAYIVKKENRNLHGIIIATGSEVQTALLAASQLYAKYKLDIRVVSMPCMELFEKQSKKYKEEIMPKTIKKIVLEASSSYSWYKYVYNEDYLITIDKFGASGTTEEVLEYCGFDFVSVVDKIRKLLK